MGGKQTGRVAAYRTPLVAYVEESRPLLRGWLHAAAAVASVAMTVAFVSMIPLDRAHTMSILIFALSMVMLYTSSAVYHLRNWRGRADKVLQIVDHAMIFVLIAGTYTPLCVVVLSGPLRVGLLVLVWSLAVLGAVGGVFTFHLPRWSMTLLYVLMSWVGLIALPELFRRLPLAALAMCLVGGILYMIGAVIYALRRPNPFPHVFGFHELFHLFVIAGSVSFAVLIWVWVLPLARI